MTSLKRKARTTLGSCLMVLFVCGCGTPRQGSRGSNLGGLGAGGAELPAGTSGGQGDGTGRGSGVDSSAAPASSATSHSEATGADSAEQLFDSDVEELEREAFIKAVLARNPTVQASREAWRAARARRVQREALEDPMLSYGFGPLSIGSSMRYGQVVELSQRFPWPGKLDSLGQEAEAEARAAAEQYEAVRLDLALAASVVFDEYYLVQRALDINREHQRLLQELERSARAQYEVGRGSLQDPLQAQVEGARLRREALALEAQREVTLARINALLHRLPNASLPAAPQSLAVSTEEPAPSAVLQQAALRERAELRARAARVRALDLRTESAEREYYPDLTVMVSYNSMWADIEHQVMLGVAAPIPIQRARRASAVDEATALAWEARHELMAESMEIRREVDAARARIVEALHTVRLYEREVLPLARDRASAARAGFEAEANDFATVIAAEDQLREDELEYHTARAELSKRRAELARATGKLPGPFRGRQP